MAACQQAHFDLVSSGTANWNNYDEATFVYEEVTGDFVTLDWEGDGTLQSATSVAGPWIDVGATKPQSVPATGAAMYFRVEGQ